MVEIRTPLEAMYVAGKKDIPAEGELVSGIANDLYTALHRLDVQSARAGDPQLMTSMLKIGGEVYAVMRSALVSLDHAAQAIIKTADDFVATDDQAARDYRQLGGGLTSLDVPTHTVPPAYDPSTPGAVNPQQPIYTGANDFKPHDPVILQPTPDPVDPDTDHDQRDETGQDDLDDTPVVAPEVK